MLRALGRQTESLNKDLAKSLDNKLFSAVLGSDDRAVLSDPAVLGPWAAASREGVTQPGAWATEALMLWHHAWPFDPRSLNGNVTVVAGTRDPFQAFATQLHEAGANRIDIPGGHLAGVNGEAQRMILSTAISHR